MLSTGLVAIDATILAAAVPAVVRDLGGLSQFPWLFSVYLLAQAVSVPIYGKVADLVGRKPVMLLGVALFLVGSLLCGLPGRWAASSRSGPAGAGCRCGAARGHDHRRRHLLGRRASQRAGLPRGRLGDLVTGRADPRRHLRRLPLVAVDLPRQPAAGRRGGVDAVAPVRRGARRARPRARARIDVLGTVCSCSSARSPCSWRCSRAALGVGVTREHRAARGSVVVLVAFVLVERRAAEPVLPLWVFRHRVVGPAMATSLVVGVLLLGLTPTCRCSPRGCSAPARSWPGSPSRR